MSNWVSIGEFLIICQKRNFRQKKFSSIFFDFENSFHLLRMMIIKSSDRISSREKVNNQVHFIAPWPIIGECVIRGVNDREWRKKAGTFETDGGDYKIKSVSLKDKFLFDFEEICRQLMKCISNWICSLNSTRTRNENWNFLSATFSLTSSIKI